MDLTTNMSIRSKLVILLLLTCILSILIIAWQGYRSAKDALSEATHNQLNTLRTAKTLQVKSYFDNIENQILGFADNRVVIEALNEFRTAFHLANRESLSEKDKTQLNKYYRKDFIPRLKEGTGGESEVNHFLPKSGATVVVQQFSSAAISCWSIKNVLRKTTLRLPILRGCEVDQHPYLSIPLCDRKVIVSRPH